MNQLEKEQVDKFVDTLIKEGKAKKFLMEAGLIDEDGNLSAPYRLDKDQVVENKFLSKVLGPAYEQGDGSMDGAQFVGGQWWHPVFGCDSLQYVIDNIKGLAGR